ncbi:MAG TPA: cell division protein ZapA [Allosphingosinicella sp.]|jgi:cell division protein ZapA|nr:cell division protein ZapA [Allosphingosinicella sp.]
MAQIDVVIAARKYTVACRDGEEDHLRALAALVDKRAQDAAAALGNLTESKQLLFTSLLLADDLKEGSAAAPAPVPAPPPPPHPRVADALERLAERVESLAGRLEAGAATP